MLTCSLLNLLAGSFCYNGVMGGWPLQLSRVPVVDVLMNIWLWLGPFHLGVLVAAATTNAVTSCGAVVGCAAEVGVVASWACELGELLGGMASVQENKVALSVTGASALFMALVLARSQLRGG